MRALAVLVLLSTCAPPTVEVKDKKLATTMPVGVDSSRICNGSPFGEGVIDFAKDLREAGIDLSQGCIAKGTFQLVAEYGEVGPGSGCSEARGTATLTGVVLSATCSTPAAPTQTLRAQCQSNQLEVADGTQVFNALNACLDEFERTQAEPLRKLINTCKPTALKVSAEGYCSSDLCFSAKLLLGVQTTGVVAQLGGTCP